MNSSFPLGFVGPASGLLCGILFGFVLENGGLGNGCKLTAQLRLKDWTVFNVMFTAIIVAATGLYLLETVGLIQAENIYTPTTFLWATLLGGSMVGLGMAVGGYCPGTSVVAACGGRIDGIFFFGGILVGTVIFANAYDWIKPVMGAAAGPESQTLDQLLHLPAWIILLALAAMAFIVGRLTRSQGQSADVSKTATSVGI
ncbi:MAG: hypothetical protein NVS1B6_03730 [Steroidobacteraceae bacterium]